MYGDDSAEFLPSLRLDSEAGGPHGPCIYLGAGNNIVQGRMVEKQAGAQSSRLYLPFRQQIYAFTESPG